MRRLGFVVGLVVLFVVACHADSRIRQWREAVHPRPPASEAAGEGDG